MTASLPPVGIPYAEDAVTNWDNKPGRICPVCRQFCAEEYDGTGEILTNNYGQHYQQEHSREGQNTVTETTSAPVGWHLAADHPISECRLVKCGWPSPAETYETSAHAADVWLRDPRWAGGDRARLALFNDLAARYGKAATSAGLTVALMRTEADAKLPPEPVRMRRGCPGGRAVVPEYADLVDLADARCEDGYVTGSGRFYLAAVEGEPGVKVYCPAQGGSCYSQDRLTTDDHYRLVVKAQAARRTA